MSVVDHTQRFRRGNPCPICDGFDEMPRGKGTRCSGFLSQDGKWAHCTRDEHAGGLPQNPSSLTYAHRLEGDCRCGTRHDPRPDLDMPPIKTASDVAYDYTDAEGQPLFQVVRLKGEKRFRQRRPDPDHPGEWIWNLKGVTPVLYGLPASRSADRDQEAYVVEGEKDAVSLQRRGFVATTNPGGVGKWRDEYSAEFVGRRVVIIPDNDEPGHKHAAQVAASIHRVGPASLKVVELPGLSKGGDVSDWLDAGGTKEQLQAIVKDVPDWLEKPIPKLKVQPLSDFEPEDVDWLWPHKIPKKKITFVVGDPGLGKSTIALDIAARVSVGGLWPNDSGRAEQGNVMVFSAEDGIADTIRPRVDGLGGDAAKIFVLAEPVVYHGDDQEGLDLRRHLDAIEAEVVKHDIKLLIVDPVLAFTGAVNTHKAAEVRAMLSPLAAMAERHGLAVIGVMHLNKRSGDDNPAYRVSASLDFVGVARSVFLVAKNPENPEVRHLAHFKSNLGPITKTMVYKFGEDGVLAWHGTADVDAKTLLAPSRPRDDGEAPERDEAKEWLLETLDGGPLAADVVLRSAKQAGIAERTLRRAKAELRIAAKQKEKGVGKPWMWSLPEKADEADDQGQPPARSSQPAKDETATAYMFAEPWQPRGPEAPNGVPPTEVEHEAAHEAATGLAASWKRLLQRKRSMKRTSAQTTRLPRSPHIERTRRPTTRRDRQNPSSGEHCEQARRSFGCHAGAAVWGPPFQFGRQPDHRSSARHPGAAHGEVGRVED